VKSKKKKTDKRQNPSAKKAHAAARKKAASSKPLKRKLPIKNRAPRAKAPPAREVGLLDAIGEVMADVEGLAAEMRDWADGMPDNQQGGNKHDEVSACAETLEDVVGNDPVENKMSFLNDIKITVQDPTPRRRGYSRSQRLAHAMTTLASVIDALEEFEPEHPNEKQRASQKDIAEGLYAALEEERDNLEGVEFPGMYG
jgi:hypothetical protein